MTGGLTGLALCADTRRSPTYSLATLNNDFGGSTNMNILTYASAVGIRPNRMWCVSLYRGTRSHENFAARGWGVLQLLRPAHAPLLSDDRGSRRPDARAQ